MKQAYRRGEIYRYNIQPLVSPHSNNIGYAMILQNDAGEIPCGTVTVALLKPSVNKSHPWRMADKLPRRLDKRQLTTRLGAMPAKHREVILSALEVNTYLPVPEILEAP
jgi:hypothetical protein